MDNLALTLITIFNLSNPSLGVEGYVQIPQVVSAYNLQSETLSEKSISLKDRYDDVFVNDVFRDNILLTLNYLSGEIKEKSDINWENINSPNYYKFSLKPGEVFAFHDQVFPDYENVVKSTNAHFNFDHGFKSDGYLMGDGVCHLASLIYWAAMDAELEAVSPVNHDFAKINGIPKEYGVSIYYLPGNLQKSANENLYIKNNKDEEILFLFSYDGENLNLKILKSEE